MSEKATLSSLIAALAEEEPQFEGAARLVPVRQGGAEAILDEIEATVIGAQLMFDTGAAQLTLRVVGRRLVSIAEANGIEVSSNVLGEILSMDQPDQLAEAGKTIAQFAENATKLSVTSSHDSGADLSESISVAALRNAMGIVQDDPDTPMAERFLNRAGDLVLAHHLIREGEIVQSEGKAGLLESLKAAQSAQLPAFIEARKATCPSHTDPSLTFCSDTVEAGIGIAVACFEADLILLAFAQDALGDICGQWRRL